MRELYPSLPCSIPSSTVMSIYLFIAPAMFVSLCLAAPPFLGRLCTLHPYIGPTLTVSSRPSDLATPSHMCHVPLSHVPTV